MKKLNIITNPQFYKSIFAILIPVAMQNLISFGISVTDTMMLGRLGEIQLSASAQANQPFFIFTFLTFGLAGGGTVLTSQYWGKKNLEAIRRVIGLVLRVAIIGSMIMTAAVLIFSREIMGFYLKDEVVIDEAVKYLQIVGWSYLFFGITSTFTGIIRSVEIVKVAVVLSLISFIVNFGINYTLIFGNFGFPALGIRGAAIGTLTARIIEFSCLAVYALFIDKKLKFRVHYIFKKGGTLLKDYIRYSLPVVLNEVAWGCGISLQAAILGRLSMEIVAANSIASVLQQLSTVVLFGAANAACVIVGKKIGEGDIKGSREAANTMMLWSVALGFVSMLLILILRKQFVGIYNVSDYTRVLTENLIIITAVITFFVAIAATAVIGVLRGAGDTKYAFFIDITALWCIAIPLGAIAGLVFHAPILLTFALLKADEPIKAIAGFIRTTREKTYKNVTR